MPASSDQTVTLKVLSTGAPKGGVSGCANAFGEKTGSVVDVSFVTAPALKELVEEGTAQADVIVAPVARMDGFQEAGQVRPDIRTVVGSVKAGVVIRDGAHVPDISSADSLKSAILAAESVVYNVATSGQYIVQMMDRLGVADEIKDRVTTVPNGSGVMMHLADSPLENEIGFGQLTEIRVHEDRGITVRLVGALPKELENVTTYCAAIFAKAEQPALAKSLIEFMATDEGREICMASGLEF